MSGTSAQLLDAIRTFYVNDPTFGHAISEAAEFLLYHQYVRSPYFLHQRWRVDIGSGMGLRHSGGIADVAFYGLVEPWLLSPEVSVPNGVVLYKRFRDDVFMILSKREKLVLFCRSIIAKASAIFKVECVTVSRTSVEMLAFNVSVSAGALCLAPKQKLHAAPLSASRPNHTELLVGRSLTTRGSKHTS